MPMTPSDNYLEEDLAPHFKDWQANPGPESNVKMLKVLQPHIEGAVNAHVGQGNPLLTSQARRLALGALRSYDPKRSRLRTHLFNQLRSIKRVSRQQGSVLKVPEKVSLDRYHLDRHTVELQDELGREPSTQELADKTGFSMKRIKHVRSYSPAVAEGTVEAAGATEEGPGEVYGAVTPGPDRAGALHELVYGDLSPTDQLIMEHSLGLHGRRPLANHQIAARVGRSPGLVSQRKKVIQGMLDRAGELGPF